MPIKISVVTINLNNLSGLKRTFESVIGQGYSNLEYLIIDGGSTDGSKEFIKNNSKRLFFWLSEKDSGVYEAMNKGIRNSNGDYLLFLNSGDYFSGPHSLSKLIDNSQGEDLVYGNLMVQETEKVWIKKYPKVLDFRYLYFETLPHPACLISMKLFARYGLYDTTLRIVSDWKFFLLVVAKYKCSFKYVDQEISSFSLGGLSSKIENQKILNQERILTLKKFFSIQFFFYSMYLKITGKNIY